MEELSNVDQDESTEKCDDVAATLIASFLIGHKDKDVRVCLACCFADILRIYAPEAPYNEQQLKVRISVTKVTMSYEIIRVFLYFL